MKEPKIIIALDFETDDSAMSLVEALDPLRCKLKVGKEMFTRYGPIFVSKLISRGFKIFLDLKYHDIPNTVRRSCEVAADLGVWMVNVHALGGSDMMRSAKLGLGNAADRPLLTAVTVLTSHDDLSLEKIGITCDVETLVLRLAGLAADSGLDGVVCSGFEAAKIKEALGRDFVTVTPGIRPNGDNFDDQKRVMTPAEAIKNGSDYLVIGRPVTRSIDPMGVIDAVEKELSFYS